MRRRHRLILRRLTRPLLLYLLLPLAALLTLRLLWGYESAHRLSQVQADLRAQGIRFEHPPVNIPDDQNALAAIIKAADLTAITSDQIITLQGEYSPIHVQDWSDEQKTLFHTLLDRHQEAFHCIDLAVTRPAPAPWAGADYDKRLARWRSLARLSVSAALYEHLAGNDLQALRHLQRIYVLADVIDHGGSLLHHLVAVALRSLLAVTIEEISLDLRLDDPVACESAFALIKMLNDPRPLDSAAWNYELEIGLTPAIAAMDYPFNAWWIRPLRDDDIARTMRLNASLIPVAHAQDWPTSQKLAAPFKRPWTYHTHLENVVLWSSQDPIAINRAMTLHFRSISDTRAAAILLASRLYQSKYQKPPASLADLVPEFLPDLLRDPFSPIAAPMHFRFDPQGPTVWSVGENLSDEGGPVLFDFLDAKLRRIEGKFPNCQPDIVYGTAWLTAKPPPKPASPGTGPGPWVVPSP